VTAPRTIIITAINDLYLTLAHGMLRSLRSQVFSIPFDIGVIDVGLSESARAHIEGFGATVVAAQANIDYPGRTKWEQQHPAFRALTSRPFLRGYFPGYDAYMWMDADMWAQTPDAIETMLGGATSGDELYICSEIDRDYATYFLGSRPWELHLDWYRTNFSTETVSAIFPRPMLNAGVWAMSATSPVWQAWQEVYSDCLRRTQQMTREQFMCDQLSLNVGVYTQGLPLKIMPAEFNWLTIYAVPVFNSKTGRFVRPTQPRTVISMMHLTHEKKMRTFDLSTTEGGTLTRTLMNEII
jgi:hypothetical protein